MRSIIHIETDLECKVLHYGAEFCIASPGQDVSISLRKGRHKLTFISIDNPRDTYTIIYTVPGNDIEDCIEVQLKGIRQINDNRLSRFDKAAVDLGLSVKWSAFNLGASRPEEYGDYYAWGETKTKTDYCWGTYKWSNGKEGCVTKYCDNSQMWDAFGPPDHKIVLEPEDDAAHMNLGGSWRMPTNNEWNELIEKCKWEWMTVKGVDGYKITGPNGNSIFLPAAGKRDWTGLNGSGFGFYWSSSLVEDLLFPTHEYSPDSAVQVVFYSQGLLYLFNYGRDQGFSIRPVV